MCAKSLKQQGSFEELFFLYLQQECTPSHGVLILKGIAKVLHFSVIILLLNCNLQCVFWIGFSKKRKRSYCRALSVAFSVTRKALPEGFFSLCVEQWPSMLFPNILLFANRTATPGCTVPCSLLKFWL